MLRHGTLQINRATHDNAAAQIRRNGELLHEVPKLTRTTYLEARWLVLDGISLACHESRAM
jgi:hypothetical protein